MKTVPDNTDEVRMLDEEPYALIATYVRFREECYGDQVPYLLRETEGNELKVLVIPDVHPKPWMAEMVRKEMDRRRKRNRIEEGSAASM